MNGINNSRGSLSYDSDNQLMINDNNSMEEYIIHLTDKVNESKN